MSEILNRHSLGYDQRLRSSQGLLGVSQKKRNGEDVKQFLVRIHEKIFIECNFSLFDKPCRSRTGTGSEFNLGIIFFHYRSNHGGYRSKQTVSGRGAVVHHDTKNSFCIFMIIVITQLVTDIDQNEETTGHANGKSGYIYPIDPIYNEVWGRLEHAEKIPGHCSAFLPAIDHLLINFIDVIRKLIEIFSSEN